MTDRVSKKGEILKFQVKRRFSKLSDLESQREYVRYKKRPTIRSRRQTYAEAGQDPEEQRAASVEGSLLERIVYKRLTLLLGPPGASWKYKHGLGTVRIFKGGYELDFLVFYPRLVALEVQGEHWHSAALKYRDIARALSVIAEGYAYEEIQEWEIGAGDDYLDWRLRQAIGL